MKLIEVIADAASTDTVAALAEKHKARDFRLAFKGEDGRQAMRMIVEDEDAQAALDALQGLLGAQPKARIVVFAIEAVLPKPSEAEREQKKRSAAATTREALYDSISKNARLDWNYAVLVVLSTVVAAIGLIEDNVAVVIGAMVIAPLLGPNLALGLGTALGDLVLMRRSLAAIAAGLALAIALSFALGQLWAPDYASVELMARTDVGLDSIALALASGAAAVLSITTGLPSVLVGVMVAVALLPPAATLGLMLGHGRFDLATGAGLLLAINVVCVNLAANLVFLLKGVRPRTWWEKEKAARAMRAYILVWAVTLALLALAIYSRRALLAPD